MIKETYEKRKKAGLCVLCGRPSRPGRVCCGECAEKNSRASAERKRTLRALGRCPDCGRKLPDGWGRKLCPKCHDGHLESHSRWQKRNKEHVAEYSRSYVRKRRENGICISCGKPSRPGKAKCQRCASAANRKHEEWRLWHRSRVPGLNRPEWPSYGFCWRCGNALDTDRKICSRCMDRMAAVWAASSRKRAERRQNGPSD